MTKPMSKIGTSPTNRRDRCHDPHGPIVINMARRVNVDECGEILEAVP
jgi:hypothetical protein